MKRLTTIAVTGALAVALALTTTACAAQGSGASSEASSKTITVGFNPGPYEQMFTQGIAPQLRKKGYTVKTQDFTDGIQVNVALSEGKLDANIMQHTVYLDYVNQQRGLSNTPLVQVPGPPMGLFGGTSKTLKAVSEGATVAVPNEPSNLYRALVLLKDVGWITLDKNTSPANASLKNVASNPHNLTLQPMDNAQEVRALKDVNYAAVQGNFAVSSGLKLTQALKLENLQDRFSVVVAVTKKNKNTAWAKDIRAAYRSKSFAKYIRSHSQYDGYHLPSFLSEK
ncbi:MAG: MetQ/NlpA family ABC transporter substrate-binding protein [Microbacteriaceae bacterium]|jgi:D-methionine transport system substrate-binding protein|nr:MetQ/NlpA family ABC transporter substrate-binding protein [Microbacteriaceae bacterium]